MEFISAAQTLGNCRRSEIVRMIKRMITTPTIGSTWGGKRYVFLSAQQVAKELCCHRNTASADLNALVQSGFLVREKLGGKARKPNGDLVSSSNRSWFYRWGDAITKLMPWLLGNGSPDSRANHCTTAVQSSPDSSKNTFHKRNHKPPKTAGTAVNRERKAQERLKAQVQAVIPGTGEAAIGDSREQERLRQENDRRRKQEHHAAGFCPPPRNWIESIKGVQTCLPACSGHARRTAEIIEDHVT